MSFGACVWYFYSLSRVTPATSHLDALDKDTKLKIIELWMNREQCERFSIRWYVLEFCFGLSRQMFSFGGRPAVINYIWRGPGSQNSVFGKLQGYRHQIRQFVFEIRRWKSELPIPELPGPNKGNFELGNPSHPSVIYQNWLFHILGFCVLLFSTLLLVFLSMVQRGTLQHNECMWFNQSQKTHPVA